MKPIYIEPVSWPGIVPAGPGRLRPALLSQPASAFSFQGAEDRSLNSLCQRSRRDWDSNRLLLGYKPGTIPRHHAPTVVLEPWEPARLPNRWVLAASQLAEAVQRRCRDGAEAVPRRCRGGAGALPTRCKGGAEAFRFKPEPKPWIFRN